MESDVTAEIAGASAVVVDLGVRPNIADVSAVVAELGAQGHDVGLLKN